MQFCFFYYWNIINQTFLLFLQSLLQIFLITLLLFISYNEVPSRLPFVIIISWLGFVPAVLIILSFSLPNSCYWNGGWLTTSVTSVSSSTSIPSSLLVISISSISFVIQIHKYLAGVVLLVNPYKFQHHLLQYLAVTWTAKVPMFL